MQFLKDFTRVLIVFFILLGTPACLTSKSPEIIIEKVDILSSGELGDVWQGSVSGYYDDGYQLRIYPDKKKKLECVSGRFETDDVQEGKVDKYAKFNGERVTVVGRIEDSWEFFDDDDLTFYTNVQNFCRSELVIVAIEVVQ